MPNADLIQAALDDEFVRAALAIESAASDAIIKAMAGGSKALRDRVLDEVGKAIDAAIVADLGPVRRAAVIERAGHGMWKAKQ
ncbi:hypothetical protein [Mesorhizobium sp. M2A.F.Ca.ET.039.01.1.1]|uniref:hypothetical protein n=1 Tax=Mesorhizobium sp. M2A.F.Ca.ET.039.01.1.1 TaxID=2496746 RepID=UPI000FCC4DD8|nr:hypothetical protein [Mesorhizobium sp. M2A.F.Ca.ET.039.01.1.1]RWX72510.1 hypothetical protein EOA24_00525 [Mesorhizobium sp. M2A.F.Ca.ET.039.01.1.1]